jgi:hypothetical protein
MLISASTSSMGSEASTRTFPVEKAYTKKSAFSPTGALL